MLTKEQILLLENVNLPLLLLLEAEELNSDDEPDASKDEVPAEEVPAEEESEEEYQPTEEEIFTYEMQGSEDKFLQFTLYDKLGELGSKIKILQDNVKNDKSSEAIDLLVNLAHYSQYINVLNELIFTVSTSTIYKILGQIELELIDMLELYNASLEKQNKEN